jgi:drug/metabolite transporter (DMT)-like permease
LQLKVALRELPFATIASLRLVLAAGAISFVSRATRRPMEREPGSFLPLAIIGGIGVAAPLVLQALGTDFIDSAMGALLFATMPVFAIVFASLRGVGARVHLRYIVPSMLAGLGAVAILVAPEVNADDTDSLVGGPVILVAAALIAICGVESRVRWPQADPIGLSAAQMVPAAVIVAPLGIAALILDPPERSWDLALSLGSVFFLGVIQSTVMFITFMHLVMTAGPTVATYSSFISPLVAVAAGALVLGEEVDWRIGLSLLMIVVCLALLLKAQRPAASLEVVT